MKNPTVWQLRRMSLEDRLMARVIMIPESTCWHWTGCIDRDGYAKMSTKNRPTMVYRISYELFVGPIPEGMVIDHICRQRDCVNPKHLEVVTSRENTMRSPIAPAALNARKTHCSEGHELVDASHPSKKQRGCLICCAQKSLDRYHANKVAINALRKIRRDSRKVG